MTASPPPYGKPAPLRRQLILKGLLPMTLIALALTATLSVLHVRAVGAEARAVARIQATRLAASFGGLASEDAMRDALTRALSRSAPTQQAVLHREGEPDLIVDSGRRLGSGTNLRVWTSTSQGELETVSDATALRERRLAAVLMTVLLGIGVVAVFAVSRRLLERDVVTPVERVRG